VFSLLGSSPASGIVFVGLVIIASGDFWRGVTQSVTFRLQKSGQHRRCTISIHVDVIFLRCTHTFVPHQLLQDLAGTLRDHLDECLPQVVSCRVDRLVALLVDFHVSEPADVRDLL
jgi:hypothetical protein